MSHPIAHSIYFKFDFHLQPLLLLF